MSPHLVASLAALCCAVGCGARTDLDAEGAAQPDTCADGILEPAEVCLPGPVDAKLLLEQGDLRRVVTPVVTQGSVATFYSYSSKSAHTGFEQPRVSRLLVHANATPGGELTLVTLHGIDVDATGIVQPQSRVAQLFENLPPGARPRVVDDNEHEFSAGEQAGTVIGDWKFKKNTDGGAIGPLPWPGQWSIHVTSAFLEGIDAWSFVDGDGTIVGLDVDQTVTISAVVEDDRCNGDCKER